jgi:GT2 family glycosyltransferase
MRVRPSVAGAWSVPPDVQAGSRVSVVVLTYNRRAELLRTLERLSTLPEQPPIVVVDNASTDGTAEAVAACFPRVEQVRCPRNLGAAGRNEGVVRVCTPYVAFCDDDTWWAPGALERAANLLDAWPEVGAVAARVLVGPEQREDPTCAFMARSPLGSAGLPGPALIGFMAGAVVMRVDAYRDAGGYEPRLFLGGEERLLGLDLAARGWRMVYVADVVTHHHPSRLRDAGRRSLLLQRNEVLIALLRLPLRSVGRRWRWAWRECRTGAERGRLLCAVLAELPWALVHRRVVPARVEMQRCRVLGEAA